MSEEKLRRIAYISVAVAFSGLLVFLFFKYIFLVILPFLIAWAVAFAARAVASRIRRKIKLPERIIRVGVAVLISAATLGAISLLIYGIGVELWNFLSGLAEGNALRALIDKITSGGVIGGIFDTLGESVGDIIYEVAISAATALGTLVTAWVSEIPGILIFLLVTVIASIYFSLELEWVNSTAKRLLPAKIYGIASRMRRGFFSVAVRYVRSYLFLMFLTFTVMIIGFIILDRPYALLLATLVSVLDLLPVIGVGTVLLPWGLYETFLGTRWVGIGLFILFAVYEVIRQLAEPKILGKNLGVHPIITLALLYIGYSLFGIVGILFVPIFAVLINITLHKENSAEVKGDSATEHNRG